MWSASPNLVRSSLPARSVRRSQLAPAYAPNKLHPPPLSPLAHFMGVVRQHVSTTKSGGGSASSVVLPGGGAGKTQVLALGAPDRAVHAEGQDPFAESLTMAPPSYVQMADLEKKHGLLVQEQMAWK